MLTHLDSKGNAKMVDVADKQNTKREAVARGIVKMQAPTLALITGGNIKKGDVFSVARIAGIMAAKHTQELIPLCHNVPLDGIAIDIEPDYENNQISITATVGCYWKTGVEMEALTAVSVAALTVYDMCKAVDKQMVIGDIRLIKKTGGKSDFIGE